MIHPIFRKVAWGVMGTVRQTATNTVQLLGDEQPDFITFPERIDLSSEQPPMGERDSADTQTRFCRVLPVS
jgi:hypothetical protein